MLSSWAAFVDGCLGLYCVCNDAGFGLWSPRTPGLVGNYWDPDVKRDTSFQSRGAKDSGPANYDDDNLAEEVLSFVVKRIDTDKQVWDTCMVPVKRKFLNKLCLFNLLGHYLEAATAKNLGQPPLCTSADGHGSHQLAQFAFSGILPPSQLCTAPWFDRTSVTPLKLPACPFGVLMYEDKPVFGNRESAHCQKNTVDHLRSPRGHCFGGAFSSLASGLKGISPYPLRASVSHASGTLHNHFCH